MRPYSVLGTNRWPRPLTLELQLLTDRGAGGTTDLRQCTQGELNPATRAPCTTTKLTLEVSTIIESRAYAARANTRPVYSQVVSATPPSIAIEALVLGGPERCASCVSQPMFIIRQTKTPDEQQAHTCSPSLVF